MNVNLMTCALVIATAGMAHGVSPLRVESPVSIHSIQDQHEVGEVATRLQIDGFKVDLSEAGQAVIIDNFPLDMQRRITLDLTTISALAEGATLVGTSYDKNGAEVDHLIPWTKVAMFHGRVMGVPNSEVFLGIGGGLANGWIDIDGTRFYIGTDVSEGLTLIFDERNVPENLNDFYSYTCRTKTEKATTLPSGGTTRAGSAECNQLWIAFDTDNEFLENFAFEPEGATVAANAYVQMLVGTVSATLYEPQLNVKLVIPYLRFWVDGWGNPVLDPWNAVNTDGQLAEFSLYWGTNEWDVERGLAQLISSRNLEGGIATLASICTDYGYAVLGNINATWSAPLIQGNNNWDPIVFAHETGHNFGMIHTFDFANPIDECGEECDAYDPTADDFDCDDYISTIMSYCHLCPPMDDPTTWGFCPNAWQSNIRIEFAYENIIRALDHLDNLTCSLWTEDPQAPIAETDYAQTQKYIPVDIEVLANDSLNDCTQLTIIDFMLESARRGTVVQSGDSTLLYTPRGGITGTDSFTYTIASDEITTPVVGTVVVSITRSDSGPTDINDVIFIISVWGSRQADHNGDGTTDGKDLLAAIQGHFKPKRPRR